jgi:hypothetical protein
LLFGTSKVLTYEDDGRLHLPGGGEERSHQLLPLTNKFGGQGGGTVKKISQIYGIILEHLI